MKQSTSDNKIKILAVVGPTASGKSALAVELAKLYGGEVISCDSMQIYKYLNIATAKPTAEEMQGIEHHLIDFLEPTESFSVADYVPLALQKAKEISARGNLPIVCGGTGLYFSSLIDGIQFSAAGSDPAYREALEQRAQQEGAEVLLEELAQFDPEAAAKLHPNNLKRIIRAMEHYHLTGETITAQNAQSRSKASPFEPLVFGIAFRDRQNLYDRIDLRVEQMLEAGLLEEAEAYFALGDVGTASAAIGYKELKPYFDGELPLQEAVENLKKETRHYAKRQMTWFKRDTRIHWLYTDDPQLPPLVQQARDVMEKESFLYDY
ncbi:MAG: tRNA (adenosine(37)-N6)-dimethylallyltransferase MiaA [Clostridia bacterium]|nr:tRNA (adenosine(37)-N6)-dimethylallyltransferase MiaA [Clostridia bacterium]